MTTLNQTLADSLVETAGINARVGRRFTRVLPLTAWCVRLDGQLDAAEPHGGFLKDLSEEGLEFELHSTPLKVRSTFVVGVECPDTVTRYAAVSVRHRSECVNGTRIGGTFEGIGNSLLQEHSRKPFLDEKLFQYRFPFPSTVYESWEAGGILKRSVLDRVMLCPRCRSVPTFRFACRNCRSGRLDHSLLIHHFPCAFVAPSTDFERGEDLVCPKCLTRKLVAGTDFEFMPGEFTCRSCGWKDQDLEQTGHCLNCETRFAAHQAAEEELVGYDVERLDPLALLSDVE
jgi:rubredoxin